MGRAAACRQAVAVITLAARRPGDERQPCQRTMNIVVVAATRTPLGAFQGALAGVPAPRLGATAIKGALAQANVAPGDVSDVIMGNVLQAGLGQAPARQAAIHAGLPTS